jgi:hypothetical protein
MICYFEYRTLRSRKLTASQKANGIRLLDTSLRRGHVKPCTHAELHGR